MDCKTAQELFPRYIDETLDRIRKQQVRQHLDDCKDCGNFESDERYIRMVLRAAGALELPAQATASCVEQALQRAKRELAKPTPEGSRAAATLERKTSSGPIGIQRVLLCVVTVCFAFILLAPPGTTGVLWKLSWREPEAKRIGDSHGGLALLLLDLVTYPRDSETKEIVILEFSSDARNPFPGAMVAFDAMTTSRKPLWTRRLEDIQIPSDLRARPNRQYRGNQFSPGVMLIADIFVETPGSEIAVAFQHGTFSQCSIHIYDMNGTLLFQAWHDGNINGLYWMSESRQLVCTGLNGEADQVDRGIVGGKRIHPLVVFSITPELETTPRWVNTVDHTGGIEPNWYLCWSDAPHTDLVSGLSLSEPYDGYDVRSYVGLSADFKMGSEYPRIGLTLDSSGNEVPFTRHPNDPYNRQLRAGLLPDPHVFRLDDLPPINRDGIWIPGLPRVAQEEAAERKREQPDSDD